MSYPKKNSELWLVPDLGQIVELVARGMTNAQISTELWIQPDSVKQALKRIFRKLNVSTRTEMVVKLQTSRWL